MTEYRLGAQAGSVIVENPFAVEEPFAAEEPLAVEGSFAVLALKDKSFSFFEDLPRETRDQIYEKSYGADWWAVYKDGKPKYCQTVHDTHRRIVSKQWYNESCPPFSSEFDAAIKNGDTPLQFCLKSTSFCQSLYKVQLNLEELLDAGYTFAARLNGCSNLQEILIESRSKHTGSAALEILGAAFQTWASRIRVRKLEAFFDDLERLRQVDLRLVFKKGMFQAESAFISSYFGNIASVRRYDALLEEPDEEEDERNEQSHEEDCNKEAQSTDSDSDSDNEDEDETASWRKDVANRTFWTDYCNYESDDSEITSDGLGYEYQYGHDSDDDYY